MDEEEIDLDSSYKPPMIKFSNKLNNEVEFNKSENGKIINYMFKRTGKGEYEIVNKINGKKTKFYFTNDSGEKLVYSETHSVIGDILKDKKGKRYFILPESRKAIPLSDRLKTINYMKDKIMNQLLMKFKFSIEPIGKNEFGFFQTQLIPETKIKTFFNEKDSKVLTGKNSKKESYLIDLEDKVIKQVFLESSLSFQNKKLSKPEKDHYLKTMSLIYNKDEGYITSKILLCSQLSDLESLKKLVVPAFKALGIAVYYNNIDITKEGK